MKRSDVNQIALIVLGLVATLFFGVFLYRELFPEYRIYQNDYVALEKFRSSYTHEPPPDFKFGVKQLVFEREDKGPPSIDRCISCHVANNLPHFSPTTIAYDINGNIIFDEKGLPQQIPNEDYVWKHLDDKIAELTDAKVNEQLSRENPGELKRRLAEAEELKALKTAEVDGHVYDMTKVLVMHPLIGRETRSFEFHSLEEYGCTSCHNGNGRGLTTEKAHGPVFDGEYEVMFEGPTQTFIESDPNNDPKFARIFNHQPGDALLFQTTPVLVGALIQSKCMQCHQTSQGVLNNAANTVGIITGYRANKNNAIQKALNSETLNLISLLKIKQMVEKEGVAKTIATLQAQVEDFTVLESEKNRLSSQIGILTEWVGGADGLRPQNYQPAKDVVLLKINQELARILGNQALEEALLKSIGDKKIEDGSGVDNFLLNNLQNPQATGSIFVKLHELQLEQQLMTHVEETSQSINSAANNPQVITAITSDIDDLTKNYTQGQALYIAQACYACHRVAGLSRGGIGPDLTEEGKIAYPWYIKRKMVWPQWDLHNSTMPNFRLDPAELENLMTFLLGQQGQNNAVADTVYKTAIKEWESGKKLPWEKPVSPAQMHDLRYSMTVFATEGCAACHRLRGFESNVGFAIEKDAKPAFDDLYKEKEWFEKLFPETIIGSDIVAAIEKNKAEISKRITNPVRKNSILEEIEQKHPGIIEAYYSNFAYASRAQNKHYADLADAERDPLKKKQILDQLQEWKDTVHNVLMMYIQEYGLGRLIGPRPNWSGVYRSDQWLLEHFHNPTGHVPRSIMPIFPFDDTKFIALTYMLDVLGKKNRDSERQIWEHRGFDPEKAVQIHCAQCHGEFLGGNGPVAEWIYPIPKNLRNADFLRSLTKERVIYSITHGVKGTPMPPWGEVGEDKPMADGIPVLTKDEIRLITDWIFSQLPGGTIFRKSQDVPKWQYTPHDVLEELKREGGQLNPGLAPELSALPTGAGYYAALNPTGSAPENDEVNEVFDVIKNPPNYPDPYSYYIKRKYYTAANIEKGKEFFETNCAVCHGKEADGTGIRSEVMQDAKPRMLINLDWINMRDDLRLLRSIKYGVSGTSMTPWGDLTTSLQRMQLVMFIRSLSQDPEYREQLMSTLYKSFDQSKLVIERVRVAEYPAISTLQQDYDKLKTNPGNTQAGSDKIDKAVANYKQELEIQDQLNKKKATDQLLQNLQSLLTQESKIYFDIGNELINRHMPSEVFNAYLKLVESNQGRLTFNEKEFKFNISKEQLEIKAKSTEKITAAVDQKVAELRDQKTIEDGKINSPSRNQRLNEINSEITAYLKFKALLLSGLREAASLSEEEQKLYNEYQSQIKTNSGEKKNG